MPTLILVRHGQSRWNLENRFTGWWDVDLTDKGVAEASAAGELLAAKGLLPTRAFTSLQTRAIKTLHLALEACGRLWIPETKDWRLNERHYGGLTGLDKAETAARHGDEQVRVWRRSFDVPPPPMDGSVPPLEETAEGESGRVLTTRERMEMHRKNPTCNSCHRVIDPIGLALDSFDVTAKFRARENGMPLDTRGVFYDGTPVSNPAELSVALLKRPVPLVRTFTENLMAYALGRRVEYYDQPSIRAITKAAQTSDYKISALILGVIKSDAFRMRLADSANQPDKPSGSR